MPAARGPVVVPLYCFSGQTARILAVASPAGVPCDVLVAVPWGRLVAGARLSGW